ncbi:MAG: hypothetical protein OEM91_06615 [Hyphomicrobiales bacterium]|nr:hypothetical protein [Hyphomicrobiales bacterium]
MDQKTFPALISAAILVLLVSALPILASEINRSMQLYNQNVRMLPADIPTIFRSPDITERRSEQVIRFRG